MYTPFPTQQIEIEKIVKFIDSKTSKKGIFAMPVAFGKSIVIANVAMRYPEKYFINIAPNKELVKQNYEKYISYGYDASLCSASLNSNDVSKVTFATIGTLIKHADFFKNKDVILLSDEAHEGSLRGGQLDLFTKKLKKCKVVGVTATPMRLNPTSGGARLSMMNRQFKCIYSTLESVVQVSDVIAEGRWSKLIYNVENVDETKLELNTTGSDYTLKSLAAFSNANNIRQKCIEAVYRLREEGRKSCIVYVTSIEEAEAVAAKIDNAAVLHSKVRDVVRDRIIREFTSGRLQTIININCLDTETEILTSEGWVKHNEISYNHEVANWKDNEVYYEKPLNIIKRDLQPDENFYSYESNSTNFRITNKHDLLVKKKKKYEKIKIEDIWDKKFQVPFHGEYKPKKIKIDQEKNNKGLNRRITANSFNYRKKDPNLSLEDSKKIAKERIEERESLRYKNPDSLTKDECFLIGFFLGDGTIVKSKSDGCRYSVSQSFAYPIIIKKIDSILASCGIEHDRNIIKPDKKSKYNSIIYTLYTGTGWGVQKRKGVYSIIPYLNKGGSEYLKFLSKEQFKSLLHGFWMADGNHGDGSGENRKQKGNTIHNTNISLLNYLQTICVTRGIKCNITKKSKPKNKKHNQMYCLNYSFSNHCTINNRIKVKKEGFKKEKVWCVSTTSTNIITRRKGKVMVMGNCLKQGFDYPLLSSIVLARPTNSYTLYSQILGRAVRIHKNKTDAKIVDISGNYNKFGAIEDLEFLNADYVGGWAAFSGDRLLTDYALGGSLVPTKQSLKDHYKEFTNPSAFPKDPEFTFGKHKGTKVSIVKRNHEGYLFWMVDPKTEFNFGRKNGAELKAAIYRELKLPLGVPVKSKDPF